MLSPGDMLYLPPSFAHDGVAVDACTTYSVGFRAASHNEIAQGFLDHLRDELALDGRYADPDLKASAEPARIAAAMQRRVASILRGIKWDRAATARFVGTYLSDPKPDVYFDPPEPRAVARGVCARPSPGMASRSTGARNGSTMTSRSTRTASPGLGPPARAIV